MSIWTIQETERAIIFVDHQDKVSQCWEILDFMSDDYNNSPVQIPYIACYGGYEIGLIWAKLNQSQYTYTTHTRS